MKYDIHEMLRLAEAARLNAYAPYSHFYVGACIFTAQGKYHVGCNVENAAYPMGQCAEATALGNMVVAGEQKILAVLVTADTEIGVSPCGGCLQKMSEFILPETEVISANGAGVFRYKKFSDLFASQFTTMFSALNKKGL